MLIIVVKNDILLVDRPLEEMSRKEIHNRLRFLTLSHTCMHTFHYPGRAFGLWVDPLLFCGAAIEEYLFLLQTNSLKKKKDLVGWGSCLERAREGNLNTLKMG